MKEHSKIQSLVLAWIEDTLDSGRRGEVAHHLAACKMCRRYFEAISAALLPSAAKVERGLSADPFLPVRIKALAAERSGEGRLREGSTLQWTWRTVAFVLAVILGVYMGEHLSYQAPQVTDRHIVYEYSDSFWDSGIEGRWQTLSQVVGEEKQ